MRAILLASAAVLATIATPAAARNGAWYVGGDFGGMIVEDIDFDIGTLDNAVKVRPDDLGFDGSLFVGYDLGTFRLEAEVAGKPRRNPVVNRCRKNAAIAFDDRAQPFAACRPIHFPPLLVNNFDPCRFSTSALGSNVRPATINPSAWPCRRDPNNCAGADKASLTVQSQ